MLKLKLKDQEPKLTFQKQNRTFDHPFTFQLAWKYSIWSLESNFLQLGPSFFGFLCLSPKIIVFFILIPKYLEKREKDIKKKKKRENS